MIPSIHHDNNNNCNCNCCSNNHTVTQVLLLQLEKQQATPATNSTATVKYFSCVMSVTWTTCTSNCRTFCATISTVTCAKDECLNCKSTVTWQCNCLSLSLSPFSHFSPLVAGDDWTGQLCPLIYYFHQSKLPLTHNSEKEDSKSLLLVTLFACNLTLASYIFTDPKAKCTVTKVIFRSVKGKNKSKY